MTEVAAVDVSVQHDIGRQIDAERAGTPDSDLLTTDEGGTGRPLS